MLTTNRYRLVSQLSGWIAIVTGVLTLLTVIAPEWIEVVFGVEPDRDSGALEWVVVLGLGIVALLAGFVRAWSQRAARAQALGAIAP